MIYYRVAFCGEAAEIEKQLEQTVAVETTWKWCSSVLVSSHGLLSFLENHDFLPKDQLRVFFSLTESNMDEMLTRHNDGLISSSISIDQFLSTKDVSIIDVRRLELELSTEAHEDQPYIFTLPTTVQEVRSWTHLMAKVHRHEVAC